MPPDLFEPLGNPLHDLLLRLGLDGRKKTIPARQLLFVLYRIRIMKSIAIYALIVGLIGPFARVARGLAGRDYLSHDLAVVVDPWSGTDKQRIVVLNPEVSK
jgi:hypothetical protein